MDYKVSLSPHLQIEVTWIEASYWNLGMRMRVLPMAILEGALLLFLREVLHQFLRSQHEVEVQQYLRQTTNESSKNRRSKKLQEWTFLTSTHLRLVCWLR